MSRLEVPTLTGRHLSLEPLAAQHVDALAAAGSGDRSSFGYTQVPDGRDEAAEYVAWLVDDAAHDRAAPFVQRRAADGVVVGCTRFLNPLWPLGRDAPDEVEIGGTWLSASAQRTPINTEAKLLLLTHAFEAWNVQRVAICTDARNTQSRQAIERIGARFEGVLRRHRRSTHAGDGARLRDTATYAITIDDWPDVQALLTGRLATS
jgi:N-acetyltransferase